MINFCLHILYTHIHVHTPHEGSIIEWKDGIPREWWQIPIEPIEKTWVQYAFLYNHIRRMRRLIARYGCVLDEADRRAFKAAINSVVAA